MALGHREWHRDTRNGVETQGMAQGHREWRRDKGNSDRTR